MINHFLNIRVESPTKELANQKKELLEQLSHLDIETLKILASKSKKKGIAQKLKAFQHLI